MANWLLITVAIILAFVVAAFLGEIFCRRIAAYARRKRAGIAYNPLGDENDGDDRPGG